TNFWLLFQSTNFWLIFHIFATYTERNHPGGNRCPPSEGISSQPTVPLHCFGSDIPIVLTSAQEKGSSLIGAVGRASKLSNSRRRMCSFLSLATKGVLHYCPRRKPLDSRVLVSDVEWRTSVW
ncbi:hypothetical protein AVEN_111780-1, partial [Araneus ventricosus]